MVIPLLQANKDEIDLIEENPEDFFNHSIDVCDKQVYSYGEKFIKLCKDL